MSTQFSITKSGELCFIYSPEATLVLQYSILTGTPPETARLVDDPVRSNVRDYIEELDLTKDRILNLVLEEGAFTLDGITYEGTLIIIVDMRFLELPYGRYLISIMTGRYPAIRFDLDT